MSDSSPRGDKAHKFSDASIGFNLVNEHHLPQEDMGELISDRAKVRADEIALVRSRLAASATGHLSAAAAKLLSDPTKKLSNADYQDFRGKVTHAARLSETDKELARLEKQFRSQVRVTKEVDPYGEGSPHSWICDSLAATGGLSGMPLGRGDSGHEERLRRHGAIVARAVDRRSKYGKAIGRQLGEQYRQQDVTRNREIVEKRVGEELRALTTGGGATASAGGGGVAAFVAPAILLDAWAQYNSPAAVFISQLNNSVALPDFGLTAYVPIVTTGTSVASHTENTGVSEGDPITSFASGAIVEKAGQITVSQATLDRVGPGISGDVLLYQQLKNQLAAQVDLYAITQVISGAQTVSNSGSFAMTNGTAGVGGFLKDLKTAKNLLHDAAGVRIRATHCFALGDFCDYIASYNDAQGRPLFSPAWDDNRQKMAEGCTGYVLVGLDLYADDSIPTTGGTSSLNQILVTKPSEILQLSGAPVQYLMPQGAAGNLDAILGVRQYVTTISRYASGTAVIGGTAYAGATFV